MKSLLLWLVIGSLAAWPGSATGQTPFPRVKPGSVGTVVLRLSGPFADTTLYRIEGAPGIRILGATSGVLPEPGASVRRLPVAFVVPADAAAGELLAGSVLIRRPDGREARRELRVVVEKVRGLDLAASSVGPGPSAGGTVPINFRISNTGNAPDTVRVRVQVDGPWIGSAPSAPLVIAPGSSISGTLGVGAPRSAPDGEYRSVRVVADGVGSTRAVSIPLVVSRGGTGPFGLARIPASVFVGSSTLGGTNLALSGSGRIGPRTEVGVALHRIGSLQGHTYGQTDLWGPRELIFVRHGDLRAELGDVSVRNEGLLAGVMGDGSGVRLQHRSREVTGGMTLARPRSGLAGGAAGRLVQGEFGVPLGGGTVSAQAVDYDWGVGSGFEAGRMQMLGIRYVNQSAGPHRVTGEVGVIGQGVGRPEQTRGTGADASYAFTTPRVGLSTRVRRTPDLLNGTTLLGDELSFAGSASLLRFLRGYASAYQGSRDRVGGVLRDQTRGSTTGLQLHHARQFFGLSWSGREYQGGFTLGGTERRNTLTSSVGAAEGPVSLLASAEMGWVERGTARPYRVKRFQTAVRWTDRGQSLWLSSHYTVEQPFRTPLQTEVGTQLRRDRGSLDAVLGTNIVGGRMSTGYIHVGGDLHLDRELSLVGGTRYQPGIFSASPWTVSLGLRRRLPLPLPLREIPPVRGVVFDDLNGNGRRDRGEPGVSGVRVRVGSITTVTGTDGRFGIRSPVGVGTTVELETGSLDRGLLALVSQVALPGTGRVSLSVVRAVALDVHTFHDADGDGARDAGEGSIPDAVVVLRGITNRAYSQASDARGRAAFAALPPGAYRFAVVLGGTEVASGTLELSPGERATREIGIALRTRPVRMGPGAPGRP